MHWTNLGKNGMFVVENQPILLKSGNKAMANRPGQQTKLPVPRRVKNCAHTSNFVHMEKDLHLLEHWHAAISLEINGFQYSHKQMVTNGFKQVHELVVNATHYQPTMEVKDLGWIAGANLGQNGIFVVEDHQLLHRGNKAMANRLGQQTKLLVPHKVDNCAHTSNFVHMEKDLHLLEHWHTEISLEINGFQYSHKEMVTNGFKQVHELVVNATHYQPTMEVMELG